MKNTLKYIALAVFLEGASSPAVAEVTWPKPETRAQHADGTMCLIRSPKDAKRLGEFVAEVKRPGDENAREIPYNRYTQGDCLKKLYSLQKRKCEELVFRGKLDEVVNLRKLSP